jgi:hypothetical protein
MSIPPLPSEKLYARLVAAAGDCRLPIVLQTKATQQRP